MLTGITLSNAGETQPTEMRAWKSTAGTTIQAKATALNQDQVALETAEGRKLNVPLAKLSDEDQAFLRTHFVPKAPAEETPVAKAIPSVPSDWKPLPMAEVSASMEAEISSSFVTVGDPGNTADTNGQGAVGYIYRIAKHEVTNAQYVDFLNAADPNGSNPNWIYHPNMNAVNTAGIAFIPASDRGKKYHVKPNMGNKPVTYVSWYDAARYANWFHNGKGTGDTETGAYTLDGNNGMPPRNPGAKFWVPSDDEWYKAAYFDPSPAGPEGADNYWMYPTRSDIAPRWVSATAVGDAENPGRNMANRSGGAKWNGENRNVITVGSLGAENASYYGTFDQGGNVSEWNDTIAGICRGVRGGSYDEDDYPMKADSRNRPTPDFKTCLIGFRIACAPEP